jgi:CheY-like chemotaxis protein
MTKPDTQPLAGLRILIAEDETMIAMLLEDMLNELGAEIVGPVKSIDEALGAIEDNALDAAMLDVNLRGERVYAVAAELQRRSIPIVFVSGYSELFDCPPEFHHVPYLKKPFRLDDLSAALETAMTRNLTP